VCNKAVVELARRLGLKSYKIVRGDPADLYVVGTPWTNADDEAYLVGDVMCAVIEKITPLLQLEEGRDAR
jgi:hypothetical protein